MRTREPACLLHAAGAQAGDEPLSYLWKTRFIDCRALVEHALIFQLHTRAG
jgi:hypothetical protein